jgi:hypothetical protein
MKQIYVTVILFAFFSVNLQGIAQSYLPIPDSNAKWIMENGDGWGGNDYTDLELADFKDDTLINSMEYIKITLRFYSGAGYYAGAFRNGNPGKVYYMPIDSINEYVLFDFTANTGDTVTNVAYHMEGWGGDFVDAYNFIVDSTGYVQCGPYNLKFLFLHTDADFPAWVEPPLIWVEKIGCLHGGIFNSMLNTWLFNNIWCMHNNDTVYYHGSVWPPLNGISYVNDSCINPQHVNVKENNLSSISFTPNPIQNILYIDGLPQLPDMKLSIYNLSGKEVYQKNLSKEDNSQWIITDLMIKPGLYLAIITSKKETLCIKKLIKKQ